MEFGPPAVGSTVLCRGVVATDGRARPATARRAQRPAVAAESIQQVRWVALRREGCLVRCPSRGALSAARRSGLPRPWLRPTAEARVRWRLARWQREHGGPVLLSQAGCRWKAASRRWFAA